VPAARAETGFEPVSVTQAIVPGHLVALNPSVIAEGEARRREGIILGKSGPGRTHQLRRKRLSLAIAALVIVIICIILIIGVLVMLPGRWMRRMVEMRRRVWTTTRLPMEKPYCNELGRWQVRK